MSLEIWIAFVATSAVVLAIPGPTVLLVCAYAASAGRRVGWWMVAGVAAADLVAMTASVLGLGALLLNSAAAFTLLKWIGAAYLIYLGVKIWCAPVEESGEAGAEAGFGRVDGPGMAAHAFAVTVTNPKSILFFVAFVPQFLDLSAALAPQLAVMTATFVVMAAINTGLYVLAADQMRRRFARPSARRWFNRLGGGGLIALGVVAAVSRRA